MNPDPNVLVFDTPEQVAQAGAERFVDYAAASIGDHDSFAVALAGGSTPRRAYELLATDEFKGRINWPRVHLFFGDERAVPPDDPQSNYRMVNDALISRVAIPAENVHRIIGETEPTQSAASYEAELKGFFRKVDWPRFDLVWLGMGADGHTASLFPGSNALQEETRWVLATRQPQTGQDRITLTLPVINHAARVTFMVRGKDKAAMLARVLRSESADEELPARKIKPVNGILECLVDRAAASAI
ncbi:MAG TPA: 6-phosphogluconolactonase [Pyrinomonadaceae bacterium]|nr:6-phosphogluconolactonase [Pyrinomonadaceae bacterium]